MWPFSSHHQNTAVTAHTLNQEWLLQQANRGIASLGVPRPGPATIFGVFQSGKRHASSHRPLGWEITNQKARPARLPRVQVAAKCSPIKPFRMPARCMRARSAWLSQTRLGDHFAGIGQLGQQGLDVSEVGGHGAKVAVVDAQADLGGVLFGSLSPGQLFTIVDFQQDIESQANASPARSSNAWPRRHSAINKTASAPPPSL